MARPITEQRGDAKPDNPPADPASPDQSALIARQLSKTFTRTRGRGDAAAVTDVNLDIHTGEFFSLVGPSGCGKTTLLRCIAGLETPTSGRLDIAGQTVFSDRPRVRVRTEDRSVALVFQSYAIWPHMTVEKNAGYALEHSRRLDRGNRVDRRRRVREVLDSFGLGDYATSWPSELSGGQQQRLALARAILSEPAVLLLDEPLSNLDSKLRVDMRRQLREFHDRTRVTTIYVTHDRAEALSMSDRIAVMSNGLISQIGSPREVYASPASSFVASFVADANLIPGTVADSRPDGLGVQTALGLFRCRPNVDLSSGDEVHVCVRPEDVEAGDAASGAGTDFNTFLAKVDNVDFTGDRLDMTLAVPGQTLQVRGHPRTPLTPGDEREWLVPVDTVVAVPR